MIDDMMRIHIAGHDIYFGGIAWVIGVLESERTPVGMINLARHTLELYVYR